MPPDTLSPRTAPLDPAPATGLPQVEYLLAGALGVQLSQPLASMENILHELLATGRISRSQVQSLMASLGTARSVARQSQQLARLAQNPVRQSHERLHLDDVVRQALQDRSSLFRERDIEVLPRLKPVEVVLDPGLLSGLLDAAFAWATAQGTRMVVSLDVRTWQQRALLQFKIIPRTGAAAAVPDAVLPGGLSWHLLAALAQAMDVAVSHSQSAAQALLVLEFGRTVGQLQSLGLGDVETSPDSINSYSAVESRSFQALRILLATNDAQVRTDAEHICRSFSLPADYATSAYEAVRCCSENEALRLVILDTRLSEEAPEALLAELQQVRPGLAVIEVDGGVPGLTMPGWLGDPVPRVGRAALQAELPQVLAQELSRLL